MRTTELLDLEYREYTEDGRFITSAGFLTRPNLLREDIETILDPELTPGMESYYISSGILTPDEKLKPLWPTNIIVRHPGTGRLMKWKHV